MKLYQKVAGLMSAYRNADCPDWTNEHAEKVEQLTKEFFPHGSGFDGNVFFSLDNSTKERLVFFAEFHHMNENGYYDGWSTLKVVVKPSLQWGFDFKLTGIIRKYRFDREYFEDTINHFLETELS